MRKIKGLEKIKAKGNKIKNYEKKKLKQLLPSEKQSMRHQGSPRYTCAQNIILGLIVNAYRDQCQF